MEWIAYLILFIGLVTPCSLFYYSINRKLKKAEVKEKEIDIIRKLDDEWQELYLEAKSKYEGLEKKVEELYEKVEAANNRANILELENQKLTWYRCVINGCKRRQPPHVFDVNGNELEALESK